MNQQVLAGLGNMLSDEICWRARLHPNKATNTLHGEELSELYRVLKRTIRAPSHGVISHETHRGSRFPPENATTRLSHDAELRFDSHESADGRRSGAPAASPRT